MNGIIAPRSFEQVKYEGAWHARIRKVLDLYRYFLIFTVLPTLAVAFYYYVVASNQYETTADFVVRKSDAAGAQVGGGQIFGIGLGASAVPSEAYIINDYLLSHDAVASLNRNQRLVERLSRSSVDPLSRLWTHNLTSERLLKYYRNHVTFTTDTETGITRMAVHAFTRDDAYQIGQALLRMGEEQVNRLNIRTYQDQVVHARREAFLARGALQVVEQQLTQYRQVHDDLDPEGSGKAQISLVSNLTAALTAARARLMVMGGAISHSSPQYRSMLSQVRALEAQLAVQSQNLTQSDGSIASRLGGYEGLLVKREAAVRRYTAAAAAYETARSEADRKQTYLIRVVDANHPEKALFPERSKIVVTVFLALIFAYSIGWLLVQGVKEHEI